MKKNIIISLIIFIIWTFLTITNRLIWFDKGIYSFINSFECDSVTRIMKFFTFFAETKTIVALSILSLISLWWGNKKSLYLAGTILSSTILNVVLKLIFKRDRPTHFHYVVENTYSFPSGHAMASMSFYGTIIVLVINSSLNKKYKYLISVILGLLIFFIGVSRIYLGVHFPSDIIGGWILSFILLNVLNEIMKRRKNESINNRSK